MWQPGAVANHINSKHWMLRHIPIKDGKVVFRTMLLGDLKLHIDSAILPTGGKDFFILSLDKTDFDGQDESTFLHAWLVYVGHKKLSDMSATAEMSLGKYYKSRTPCPIYTPDVGTRPTNLFETAVLHLGDFTKLIEEIDSLSQVLLKVSLQIDFPQEAEADTHPSENDQIPVQK